jgi:hypothetical protein
MMASPGLGERHHILELASRRDAQRAGDDGDVAGRAGILQHEPAQLVALVIEQLRRAHVARHDHAVVGRSSA